MSVALEDILRTTQSTLPHYLRKAAGGRGLINETTARTIGITGLLWDKAKTNWPTSYEYKTKLQLSEADVGQWTAVGQKLSLKGTPAITWTSWPRRFYRWAWFLPQEEIDTNQGDAADIIHNLQEQAAEDAALCVIRALHAAVFARDGNYLHDGSADDYLKMFGLRHLLTLDGLHISGTGSIGGINPTTQTLWRNPFISPVGSSDYGTGAGTITSATEIPRALRRAFRMLDIQGVDRYGKLAAKVEGVKEERPQKNKPGDGFVILASSGADEDLQTIIFDRQDNHGVDQATMNPVYKGVQVMEVEALGMNSYGYGYNDDGSAAWTDRTGSYASGNWPSYQEIMVINTDHLILAVHPDHNPASYPTYKPEGMVGVAYEGDIWPQLACDSRRRLGCYIGPFPSLN